MQITTFPHLFQALTFFNITRLGSKEQAKIPHRVGLDSLGMFYSTVPLAVVVSPCPEAVNTNCPFFFFLSAGRFCAFDKPFRLGTFIRCSLMCRENGDFRLNKANVEESA